MFGPNFRPPRGTIRNLKDHLWEDGRDEVSTADEKRRRAMEYAEELRRQIAEREGHRHGNENNHDDGNQGVLAYQSAAMEPMYWNDLHHENNNTIRQIEPTMYQQNTYQIDEVPQNGIARYVPKNDYAVSPGGYASRGAVFAEALKAQIDEKRRADVNPLSVVQPLPLVQPQFTFAGGTSFDNVSFEMPNISFKVRSAGDLQRMRSVSMQDAASVRFSVQHVPLPPPVNLESPFENSKVATPATGFSVRGGYKRARFSDTKFTPIYTDNMGNNYDSNFDDLGDIDVELPCESRMIYPDGHQSPM